jgi:ferric-dicitrate binding protein FerR (iron transport regulator)
MSELPRDDAEYLRIIEGQVGDDPGAQRAARLLALADSVMPRPPALDVDSGGRDLNARLTTRRALRWLEVAVGVAALIVFSVVTYVSVAPVVAAHADERYEAPATAPVTVRMPDGSRATLAPLARITYRASFFRPARTVTLEGEAEFRVRADTAHAFEVHAGSAIITAVGTVFTVRANPWESTIRVAVEEGAVLVAPVHRRLQTGEELIVER